MKRTILYLFAVLPAMASVSLAQQDPYGGGGRGGRNFNPQDPNGGGGRAARNFNQQDPSGGTGGAGGRTFGQPDPRGVGGPAGLGATGGRRSTLNSTPQPRSTNERESGETPRPKAITDPYKPLLQVSIFSRDRRSSDDSPSLTSQTTPPDKPESYYALRGVVIENGEPVAFVENTHDTSGPDGGPGPNAYIHVKVGEPLAGGKVTAITLDQIEFERSESVFSTRVRVGYALNGLEMTPPEDAPPIAIASGNGGLPGGMTLQQAQLLMRQGGGRGTRGFGFAPGGAGAFGPGGASGFDPSMLQSFTNGRTRGTRGGAGGGGYDPNDPTGGAGSGRGRRGGRGGGGGGGFGG